MRGFRNHVVRVVFALILSFTVVGAGVPASADSPPSQTDTAVVDRFEGTTAVLVFDSGDVQIVERSQLPPSARHVDAVLHVTRDDGAIVKMRYDDEETRERTERAQDRFDRLARASLPIDSFGTSCGYDRASSVR